MKNVLTIAIFFFISACNNKSSVKFNDELISKIASEDLNLPSRYGFYLFAKCSNDEFVQTNIEELRVLYKRDKNNMKFDDFLREVLNQNRALDLSNQQDCFSLDDDITNVYNTTNFESFKNTFFEKKETNSYVLKRNVKAEKRNTIFYYCFVNNYVVVFDDYIGYYYLNKIGNDLNW